MQGWMKLYRKIWKSKSHLFAGRNRGNKILMWIWMLTNADENGLVTFGRRQVALDTDLSDQQVKRIIEFWRLKATSETTIKATNQYTSLLILNWHKLQDKATSETTHEVIANRPLYKNKEDKNIYTKEIFEKLDTFKEKYPTVDIEAELEKWEDHHRVKGTKIKDYPASFRTWCRNAIEFGHTKKLLSEHMIGGKL